jgi:hypothetical protein
LARAGGTILKSADRDGHPSEERGFIESARVRPVGWRDTPLPFFLAALVPCGIVVPLRFFLFPDADPLTVVLLGPALEEGLKFAALFLALMGAALALPRGRDPENALRYWLFLAPWFVGGVYGLMEGLTVYPGESQLNFTLREVAHAAFTALALAATIWAWRETDRPYAGVALGFGVAWSVHILFNSLALVSMYVEVSFLDQALYGLAVFAIALVALARNVGREPGSR